MAEGVARSGWDKDLRHGEARESAFVGAIREARVECKSDAWTRRSGKVCIEIRQGSTERGRGRPSGASETLAEWWSIEYADDCWLTIRTSLLKALVGRAKTEFGTHMLGDYGKYECVLIPVGWFVTPFKAT